jgi:hypothetical protein
VTWSSTRFRATRQIIVIDQAADVDGVDKEFEKTKRGQEPISLKVCVPFFSFSCLFAEIDHDPLRSGKPRVGAFLERDAESLDVGSRVDGQCLAVGFGDDHGSRQVD